MATDLLRHPRVWKAAQAYRSPGTNGVWVVEAVYHGPTEICTPKAGLERNAVGVMHLANRDIGVRRIVFVDDPILDDLVRI